MFSFFKKEKSQPETTQSVPAPVKVEKPAEPEALSVEWFAQRASDIWRWEWQEKREGQRQQLDEALTKAFPFSTKAEYLEWRAAWKASYKAMTEDARQGRNNRNGYGVPITKYHGGQRRVMMRLRMEGKQRSWALKQARLLSTT